jgi:integrase
LHRGILVSQSCAEYLAHKVPNRRIWPGRWQYVAWLATDLKNAGIPEFDDRGRRITFHSLKRRYVMRLIKAGGEIHEVRRLARHRDVKTTLQYYTDTDLKELGRLTEKFTATG